MVDKFSPLWKKFKVMYNEGKSYYEISKELEISIPTIYQWRKKLGLRSRRNRTPRSWMDIPNQKGITPREILQSIAKPLGITQHDIEFILTRVSKLKSKGHVRGRRLEHVILAAAFMYLRWEGSGRRPVTATKFIGICHDYNISRAALLKTSRLFTSAGLYPRKHLRPEALLKRTWKSLQEEYGLPETVKKRILTLVKNPKFQGRSPSAVVAACVYIACYESGHWITQSELEKFFGVTEVSIRNVRKCLKENWARTHALLPEDEGGDVS